MAGLFKSGWLWGGAASVALGAHLVLGYAVAAIAPAPRHDANEQALEIDLQPIIIDQAMAAEPEELIEEASEQVDEVTEAEPETVEETLTEEAVAPEPETVEEVEQETAMAEPVESVEPEPEPVEEEVEEVQETPAPKPEVVLPRPKKKIEPKVEPKKKEIVKVQPKKVEPKREAKAEPKKAAERKPATTRTAVAKPTTNRGLASMLGRPNTPKSGAAAPSRAPTVNRASWDKRVRGAVAARAPRGVGKGSVGVSFVVTSSGAISGVRLARSSGDAGLDNAVLSAVRGVRAPAPPAGLGGASFPFSVLIVAK